MAHIFKRYSDKQLKIALLGLEYAGKSWLLQRLLHLDLNINEFESLPKPMPTRGLDSKVVENDLLSALIIDVGGQKNIRPLWAKYLSDAMKPDVIVYVIDSADPDRFQESYTWFRNITDSLEINKILIFANKQDLLSAHSVDEIETLFGNYEVIGTSAITGEGLMHFIQVLLDYVLYK